MLPDVVAVNESVNDRDEELALLKARLDDTSAFMNRLWLAYESVVIDHAHLMLDMQTREEIEYKLDVSGPFYLTADCVEDLRETLNKVQCERREQIKRDES